MLTRIESITGTGLFHEVGMSPPFARVTLGYGENGRGKSTLAAILRSCAENQGSTIGNRGTIGGYLPQTATLTFSGSSATNSTFGDGSWSYPRPEITVFDADFVSRNVYAGTDVTPEQRSKLLLFALGEEAVTARKAHDQANSALATANITLREKTAVITARRGALSLAAYKALKVEGHTDEKIAALQTRLVAARDVARVQAQPGPTLIPQPPFNAEALFEILAKHLPHVAAEAEAAITTHLSKCADRSFESWLSQGSAYKSGDECPYCGQDTSQVSLVTAYQAHFNKAYEDLKKIAATLQTSAAHRLGEQIVDAIASQVETAQAHINNWSNAIQLAPLKFNATGMKAELSSSREIVMKLADRKANSPLESVGTDEDLAQVKKHWEAALEFLKNINDQIAVAIEKISHYKKTLAGENIATINAEIQKLELSKHRNTQAGADELQALHQISEHCKNLTSLKDIARKSLDAIMEESLAKYRQEINNLLSDFGAQIRIERFSAAYRGSSGAPRSDYEIELRGTPLKLSGSEGAAFGHALSEGDKRSLAFAFFIARLRADPLLTSRIVVIDDPMCSLDRRRRAATIRVLKTLALHCKQLIIFAHDAFFLRDLGIAFSKQPFKQVGSPGYFKITSTTGNYSTLAPLDIDQECQGSYEINLNSVSAYVANGGSDLKQQAAKAIRPLVEGAIHRQFPGLISRGLMLGQCIKLISEAPATSALASLKPHTSQLNAINDYATQFHHNDGEESPEISAIDEGELRGHCERSLAFVFR